MHQSRRAIGAVAAVAVVLAGCATMEEASQSPRAGRGAAIGAVAGGVIGNVVAAPGLRTQGAAIGDRKSVV